jgi:methionine aminotransferase
MPDFNYEFPSKLPFAGTSIFAVMSKMAQEHNAINLSQGFPDFPISETLIDRVHHYMKLGYNQYAPMPGVPALRKAIAAKALSTYGISYDADTEVTVTAGATQALFTAITAFVHSGDEVIIFEPAYDSYAPAIEACGGIVKGISLKLPDFHIDWNEVEAAITPRTRMIIINSPHNPSGSLLSSDDLLALDELTRNTGIIILSDEVYEHLVFDGLAHQSVCLNTRLASRSLVVGSFGKTFHATGWKTGFVMAPAALSREFRKFHQFVVFASNTPIQHALADFLADPVNYRDLGSFYAAKRDFFVQGIRNSSFDIYPSKGTYFQVLGYSRISKLSEMEFAAWLVKEHGVAAIPLAPFYSKSVNQQLLRFCFAKTEQTLSQAIERLCRI